MKAEGGYREGVKLGRSATLMFPPESCCWLLGGLRAWLALVVGGSGEGDGSLAGGGVEGEQASGVPRDIELWLLSPVGLYGSAAPCNSGDLKGGTNA